MTARPPSGQGGLGWAAEETAAHLLQRKGYQVLERRWRRPEGELDIVARHADALVFVEVKARRGTSRGSALESITRNKAARLTRLAELYLAEQPTTSYETVRIDLVAVQLDATGRVIAIDHIENAVEQ